MQQSALRSRREKRLGGHARSERGDLRLGSDAFAEHPAARISIGHGLRDDALAEIAHGITEEMNPISSHQGRGDTKRKQAAVLLRRALQDMQERAAHVGTA